MRPILLDNTGRFANNIKEIMKRMLLAILFFSFCFHPIASAGISRDKMVMPAAKLSRRAYRRPGYVQKGAFEYKNNAERLSRKLRRAGYKVFIVKGISSRRKRIYRVLARKTGEGKVKASRFQRMKSVAGPKISAVAGKGGTDEGASSQLRGTAEAPGVYASGEEVRPLKDSTYGKAASSGVPESGGTGLPVGTSPAGESGGQGPNQQVEGPVGTLRTYSQIFGTKGSYIHPSLSVTEIYTDNAFATRDNKKSNLTTILTPGIWLSLPRVTENRLIIDETSNRIPGGLALSRNRPEAKRKYQAYLLYEADIPLPSANSPYGNAVSHTGYGNFQYNGNRFSANVYDTYTKSIETRGISVSTQPGQVDRFYNNLFDATTDIDTGNRLRLRLGYSNFLVHYSDQRNKFMDRTDNSLSGYLFYRLQSKTAAFLEYRLVDISYLSDSGLDSTEHHFLAGVQWDITAKSKGSVRAGYGVKDFSGPSGNVNTFIAEARIKHQFTPKTSVTLTGFRKTDETNIATSLYAITSQAEVKYEQLLTSKITGLADLLYMNEKYESGVTAGNTAHIEDNVYQATVGLQYEFQRWLNSSIGYVYTRRDSSFSDFQFGSNTAFFKVTGSL
jgi:polysaccharide biosynthesis protein VpsM